VIAVSGYGTPDRLRSREALDSHFVKPMHPTALHAFLEQARSAESHAPRAFYLSRAGESRA